MLLPLRPEQLPPALRRRWFMATVRAVTVRRRLAGWPAARRLPWAWWCALCAGDAATVLAELGRRADGPLTFVQVGSNDGVANDPLHAVVRAQGWEGVLVEPVPELFDQLQANYAGVAGLRFENVAVGEPGPAVPLHLVRPAAGDPPWVTQLASFDKQVVLRHADDLPGLAGRVRAVLVEVVSLPELVARSGLAHVDVLHVDVEGADLAVVDQVDPAAGWAPAVIVFEKKHLAPDDFRRTVGVLGQAGYRSVNLWPDHLLYRPDAVRRLSRAGGRR